MQDGLSLSLSNLDWAVCVTVVRGSILVGLSGDAYRYGLKAGTVYGGVFYWGIDQVNVQRGVSAAYLVDKTPGGLYKYLQTISIYLVMPITPAIVFGIVSKRVNVVGASASVLTGVAVSAVFVADELMGPRLGAQLFPWLHHPLTFIYTYRGLWGTLAVVAVLFGVSLATKPPPPDKVEQTTIHWGERIESFRGWSDWRLQWLVLALITVAIYHWLW